MTAAADGGLNLALSPHSAALTTPCLARMAEVAAQNALDALDGKLKRGRGRRRYASALIFSMSLAVSARATMIFW